VTLALSATRNRPRAVTAANTGPVGVLIACPGVGHVWRGFETFSLECFEALRGSSALEMTLVKGKGRSHGDDLTAPTVIRNGRTAAALARLVGRSPYDVEQLVFAAALLPVLRRRRPRIVFVSDWLLARALAKARRRLGGDFRLLLSNGGPYPPASIRFADHVQHLTEYSRQSALEAGLPPARHSLVPLGVAMDARPEFLSEDERRRLRRRLALPESRRIVLSAAALARAHKRIDYLIEEVAALSEPRPHLVVLGHAGPEARELKALANEALGREGSTFRSVLPGEVGDYYRAADVFVLASLWEAFGRVMIEAMSHGLPCLGHDGPTQRFVLGPHGYLADLAERGALARLLTALGDRDFREEARWIRHDFVFRRFAWPSLSPRYEELFRSVSQRPPSAQELETQ